MDKQKFPQPIGAIWQHSDKSMFVKINCYREKYIAIKNSKKGKDSEPSFFLHVFKTHTGASALPFFRDYGADGRGGGSGKGGGDGESTEDILVCGGPRDSDASAGVQMGVENVSPDGDSNEASTPESLGTELSGSGMANQHE